MEFKLSNSLNNCPLKDPLFIMGEILSLFVELNYCYVLKSHSVSLFNIISDNSLIPEFHF